MKANLAPTCQIQILRYICKQHRFPPKRSNYCHGRITFHLSPVFIMAFYLPNTNEERKSDGINQFIRFAYLGRVLLFTARAMYVCSYLISIWLVWSACWSTGGQAQVGMHISGLRLASGLLECSQKLATNKTRDTYR